MAREGLGVALAQRLLAEADCAEGRLVVLSPLTLDLGHPYCLVHPHSKAKKRSLDLVFGWLMTSARSHAAP
jgi:LysR family glycine cleavage system transcriptional activator